VMRDVFVGLLTAARSSTTMPTLSIRRSVMPRAQDRKLAAIYARLMSPSES
jgi:hypothetical protein